MSKLAKKISKSKWSVWLRINWMKKVSSHASQIANVSVSLTSNADAIDRRNLWTGLSLNLNNIDGHPWSIPSANQYSIPNYSSLAFHAISYQILWCLTTATAISRTNGFDTLWYWHRRSASMNWRKEPTPSKIKLSNKSKAVECVRGGSPCIF